MIKVYKSGDAWAVKCGDVLSGAYRSFGKALETAKLIAEPKKLKLQGEDKRIDGSISAYNFEVIK